MNVIDTQKHKYLESSIAQMILQMVMELLYGENKLLAKAALEQKCRSKPLYIKYPKYLDESGIKVRQTHQWLRSG